MLKHLPIIAMAFLLPTAVQAAGDATAPATDQFCMYDGTLYTKGAILQIDGQPTLICEGGLHAPLIVNEKRALEWVNYDDWKEVRQ